MGVVLPQVVNVRVAVRFQPVHLDRERADARSANRSPLGRDRRPCGGSVHNGRGRLSFQAMREVPSLTAVTGARRPHARPKVAGMPVDDVTTTTLTPTAIRQLR